jgi:hypothetical protein
MHIEPQKEHQWLQQLVGEWTFEHACAPGQPPSTGTETVRSLGDLWILCDGRFEMPGGGPGVTLMTLGYDPAKKRFVGTFIGSMMTNLWTYEGSLTDNVLTLDAEGPGFTPEGTPTGKMARYQDVIEITNDGQRTLTSHILGDDGKWTQFMKAYYRRK